MKYIIAIIVSILIPPCLIGINSCSDKKEKRAAVMILGSIAFFVQINWGRTYIGVNLLALAITILTIIIFIKNKHLAKSVLDILTHIVNYFISELQNPILSTKETMLILIKKDIVVFVLGFFIGLFNPIQSLILILGTPLYLLVVEILLQDNTELKASFNSVLKSVRGSVGINTSNQTDYEEDGEYISDEDINGPTYYDNLYGDSDGAEDTVSSNKPTSVKANSLNIEKQKSEVRQNSMGIQETSSNIPPVTNMPPIPTATPNIPNSPMPPIVGNLPVPPNIGGNLNISSTPPVNTLGARPIGVGDEKL